MTEPTCTCETMGPYEIRKKDCPYHTTHKWEARGTIAPAPDYAGLVNNKGLLKQILTNIKDTTKCKLTKKQAEAALKLL